MRQGTVLIVDQGDFLPTVDQDKEFEEVDLYDFKLEPKVIEVHGIIIYVPTQDIRHKVLKSRYFPLD